MNHHSYTNLCSFCTLLLLHSHIRLEFAASPFNNAVRLKWYKSNCLTLSAWLLFSCLTTNCYCTSRNPTDRWYLHWSASIQLCNSGMELERWRQFLYSQEIVPSYWPPGSKGNLLSNICRRLGRTLQNSAGKKYLKLRSKMIADVCTGNPWKSKP